MKTIENTLRITKNKINTAGFFFIIAIMFCTNHIQAQDIIFMRNGNEIKAKILEITDGSVKYQNYEDKTGVDILIPKSGIFMIRYENGIKEIFDSKSSPAPVVQPAPAQTNVQPEKFDPDSSDFARIRRKKFNGPRVGLTALTPGTSADYLDSKGKRPLITQFGWQFEGRLFTVDETSGIVEFVPMIGGLEQGMFIPSASVLLGIRTGTRFIFEFAIGPNFSIVPDYYGHKKGFAGLVLAVGTSLKKGNVYFPITLAFVPSVGNTIQVQDATTHETSDVTYHSGARISLIVGFNSRKK